MLTTKHEARQEIEAARSIKLSIQNLTDDTDTIRDTLEGETDLAPMIRALILSISEDKALRDGAKDAAKHFDARATRFDVRIATKRELIRMAMEVAEWSSREFDVGTVSLKKAAAAVQINEEADIPAAFFKPGIPTLDKKHLLTALKAGPVAGATLTNGAPVLEIR